MARLPRLFAPDQPQHVIQRGNDRQAMFRDEDDYHRFSAFLGEAARTYNLAIHAYVLMPNHIHILATPAGQDSLPRVMQAVGRHYVRWFNDRHGRTGALWEGRYRSTLIDSERYFLVCSRYIELNPVRAGLAEVPQMWPWSSYAHHAGLARNALITDHPLYWSLGNTPFERQAAYLALFDEALTPYQLRAIRESTNKSWYLGERDAARHLENTATRRAVPRRRGRPRKNNALVAKT